MKYFYRILGCVVLVIAISSLCGIVESIEQLEVSDFVWTTVGHLWLALIGVMLVSFSIEANTEEE